MPISKRELRELQKAAMKACRIVEKSLKKQPSTIIICSGEIEEPKKVFDEISSFLFRRRQGNGDEGA